MPAVETVVKRYEALLRMSASQTLQTPQDIAQKLANELHSLLDFDFFEVLVFEQNTCEVLWRCMDMDQRPWLDSRMEETPAWWVHQNQQRLRCRPAGRSLAPQLSLGNCCTGLGGKPRAQTPSAIRLPFVSANSLARKDHDRCQSIS